jgi:UDP-N-acetylmuramoylalanine--D-glutamate ligase
MANVAIVGYGEQGRSAFEYWFNQGNVVVVCDQNPSTEVPPGAIDKLGLNYLEDLHEFDLIVRSPSVHPQTILDANPDHPELVDKITSNTNEFMKVCKAPIIGVTGTKGKGTTSTLIARILEEAGKKVHLGGNIGTPPLDMLKNSIQEDDIVVLELANFQLIDLKTSPHVAVCLMIVEEHLNWHKDMYEYVHSKQQIFAHQKPDDIAVYNATNVYTNEIATSSPAHTKISYCVPEEKGQAAEYTDGVYVEGDEIKVMGKTVAHVDDVKLRGWHNLQNVSAAIAATWELTGHDKHAIKKALKKFTGLPHRIETIGSFNNITYVDDSFGTNPATAIVAIKSFPEHKVIIVGGSDKNTPYDELGKTISEARIRHIIAIGETGPRIMAAVRNNPGGDKIPYSVINVTQTMEDIVAEAQKHAQPGDVVLLSTGCASFDMFKNYKDRGDQFRKVVSGFDPEPSAVA